MTGLRERSKLRRRKLVVDAAEKLFREKGYVGTTIENIASSADVSIGSLYSAFGSKGGIMRAVMQPVIERMKQDAEAVIEHPPKRSVAAVLALLDAYRFTDDWRDLRLLGVLDQRAAGQEEDLEKLVEDFEGFITGQMARLLSALQAEGKISEELAIDDAVFILYTVFVAHFQQYVIQRPARSYDDILSDLHRRVHQLFVSWT